jgi:hypothetical protein
MRLGISAQILRELQHDVAAAACIEVRTPLKNERASPDECDRTDLRLRGPEANA